MVNNIARNRIFDDYTFDNFPIYRELLALARGVTSRRCYSSPSTAAAAGLPCVTVPGSSVFRQPGHVFKL